PCHGHDVHGRQRVLGILALGLRAERDASHGRDAHADAPSGLLRPEARRLRLLSERGLTDAFEASIVNQ
ncbi:MAG: hypothetical protein P8O84_07940, partial [Synechococcus sp. cluster3_bin.96]|nr:hypothetical protein [Synechococcus sp. cluster3_bin.96]